MYKLRNQKIESYLVISNEVIFLISRLIQESFHNSARSYFFLLLPPPIPILSTKISLNQPRKQKNYFIWDNKITFHFWFLNLYITLAVKVGVRFCVMSTVRNFTCCLQVSRKMTFNIICNVLTVQNSRVAYIKVG